ncbi:glycosyltransferase family 4 protein [Pseudohoeflea coraliihabitans]|uniref:Glycosyltransferase family 4 protein n=1 Tax=Pseudohoeflea coraliihabitans TaxID=2860393 RepID=A0ABS6WLX0_9HYPH|nr:glycosyltransferase family 4 protein [Pseudohoeflea sp. DP4N28-3]MBW3096074.1 glycosyltransferase family 4 protein [Pseudohoeflea sp. DP4N28-3]
MRTALVIARDNAYGLSRDARIVATALRQADYSVDIRTPRGHWLERWKTRQDAVDCVIHLERVFPAWTRSGAFNLLIPNQERYPARHIPRLRQVDLVLAKSNHAAQIFAGLGKPSVNAGFASADRLDASIEKNWRRFFHLAGGSTVKGTEDLLKLWARHPEWPELVIVQKAANAPKSVPDNVRIEAGYIDDEALRQLQNACGIHLCPSRSEGWGHYILEAMSCGSVVVTTDGAPMNELVNADCGHLVPVEKTAARHLGIDYHVNIAALEATILRLLEAPEIQMRETGAVAMRRFAEICDAFPRALASSLDALFATGASAGSLPTAVFGQATGKPLQDSGSH